MNRAGGQKDNIKPSKTRRKKEAQRLQALGETLTRLPISRLTQLPLEDELIAAIEQFQRLPNSHGAKRRQLQFIGKLMRSADSEAIASVLRQIQI